VSLFTISSSKLSPIANLSNVLISVGLIFLFFYLGQNIIIPLTVSFLFAILLRPLVMFLNKKAKFPNILAIFITLFLFFFVFVGILALLAWQISTLADDWSVIKENIINHYESIQTWIQNKFNLSFAKQENYASKISNKAMNGNGQMMGNTFTTFSNLILSLTLIPVCTFLILLYHKLFIEFLLRVVNSKNVKNLYLILSTINEVIHGYIIGLLIQMTIIGVLTSVGLSIIGVKYAILLGLITALFNLVPYIGILTATFISVAVTLGNTSNLKVVLGVVIVNLIVQLIDNNIVVPKIVGNHVRINALASILGVVCGGSLFGIPGMFLSIPIIAIVKVVFDHIDDLKPFGFLLGNSSDGSNENALD
jgi:predicted PurR-regulated permease PerM